FAVIALLALAAACSTQKEPATKAIADAETALGAIRDDAGKFAASDLQSVEATIADLKAKLQAGDYRGILAAAPDLTNRIAALRDAVAAKKAELEAAIAKAQADWPALAADLPNMLGALRSRVDALSASRRLPKNVSPAAFEAARNGLSTAQAAWDAATAASASGDVVTAVAKAQEAKAAGSAAMSALGMTSG
ncbi:MAG: hypothetical protein NZM12_07490, partial [Steroidobacteraceae bacterium]|nr:hypothetical protein [Steroidobacteraceae bacterium]MDW8258652.1 hypothetical protein [Gammaproteobacteria bacterium]